MDNVTGLWWEVKTDDGGLRDQNNTYSWYNPDNQTNGGYAGYQNGGNCSGSNSCDTEGYVQAVNAAKLCGKSDWRLPKQSELQSIADYSRYGPAIDSDYFPTATDGLWSYSSNGFWSSSPYASNDSYAWIVSLYNGNGYNDIKDSKYYVRLVRAGQ